MARSNLTKLMAVSGNTRNAEAGPEFLSIIIPARDEAACIRGTVEDLERTLVAHRVPHEIVVVDDGSTDETWQILEALRQSVPTLIPVRNSGAHGFGRAVTFGYQSSSGDAIVIMMADASDEPTDVITYWNLLREGWDCVFGSRFVAGGQALGYPRFKLFVNRAVNLFIRLIFCHGFNDTTNAFKAYRRSTIDGCCPLLSPHFNLTVEIPLKAIIRGYTWTVTPITWRNRIAGASKLQLKEMGSRYLFIIFYCWLEKYFTGADYHKAKDPVQMQSGAKAAGTVKVCRQR